MRESLALQAFVVGFNGAQVARPDSNVNVAGLEIAANAVGLHAFTNNRVACPA